MEIKVFEQSWMRLNTEDPFHAWKDSLLKRLRKLSGKTVFLAAKITIQEALAKTFGYIQLAQSYFLQVPSNSIWIDPCREVI